MVYGKRRYCSDTNASCREYQTKNIFSSIDFLIVVQALEGFFTRFRKEDSLSNMLRNIISEFSCIDKIKNADIAINEVVNSRHYYSHFMERSKKKHILDGQELYDLTHKLRKLLICCVLHFIGFNYPQINEILNKSNSRLLWIAIWIVKIEKVIWKSA